VDAFRLLVDEGILRHIKRCTVEYAQTKESTWEMVDAEMDIFFGLKYLRGVMNAKNFPLDLLWSDNYGCQAFCRLCLGIASDKSNHSSDSTAEVLAVKE